MTRPLQGIVDTVAKRLDRAVAIDDRSGRLLAYSSHVGPVDETRKLSILSRRAPDDAWAHVLKAGIERAEGAVRVKANRKLGMEARVCAPIRAQGALLGYLWLIDPDQGLTEADLDYAVTAAGEAGAVLYREQLMTDLELGRERELLRDLVDDDADLRHHAAGELVESELFTAGDRNAVVVVTPVPPGGATVDEQAREALAAVLGRLRRLLSPRRRLMLVRPGHALVVVAADDPAMPPGGLAGVGELLRDWTVERLGAGWSAFVGIGEEQRTLADAATSYEQALQAVRVAQIVPQFAAVAPWGRLGIYRMLSRFPVEQLDEEALPPGLLRLFATEGGDPLADTLERYLDLGCDARATAEVLSLHRASLYYRLHKIEEIAGISLKDGEQRLAMHLGIKLARLAGLHPDTGEGAVGG